MHDSSLKSIAARAEEHMRSALAALGELPDSVSVSRFVADYSQVGDLEHYRHVPRSAQATVATINDAMGAPATRTFLRAAVGCGIVELVESSRLVRLPPRILGHHVKQLDRIAEALGEDADWLDLGSDIFLKDFGLVTLRLLAAAAQLLDVRCGIPRTIVLKQGLAAIPASIWTMARSGGFRPWVQIHTHLRNLEDFNEEGWNECYRCCSALYKTETKLRGMFGGSWFYDPALDKVSPRLGYLREIPILGGAHLFFVERGGEAIGNAVATSASRRKLYESGEYMPTSYMLLWARDAQMQWADLNPG